MSEQTQATPMAEVFIVIVDLAAALGVSCINNLDGAWICKIDANWTVAVNGTKAPVTVDIPDSMGMENLEPYHMAVFFNGWLAGILNPYGGTMCAGGVGNEDNLIKAIRDRIAVEELAKEMVL